MRRRRTSTKHVLLKTLMKCGLALTLGIALFIWLGPSSEQRVQQFIVQGQDLLKAEKTAQAKKQFKNALSIDKENSQALFGLAQAFDLDGDEQNAHALYKLVIQHDSAFVDAHLRLAQIYLSSNNQTAFTNTLATLEQLAPEHAEVLALKANAKLQHGENNAAISLAHAALQKDPTLTDAMMALAAERMMAKDYEASLRLLDAGIQKCPGHLAFYLAKMDVLRDNHQPEKIEGVFHALIKQYPQKKEYKKMLVQFYLQQHENSKAEQSLRTLIAQDSGDEESKIQLISLVDQVHGKQAARETFDTLLKDNPDDTKLQFSRYDFEIKLGETTVARDILQKIIQTALRREDRHQAMVILANDMLQQHKEQQAIYLVDKVLSENSKHTQALLIKSKMQMQAGNYDMAIANYRNLLVQMPDNIEIMLALASAYEQTNMLQLANVQYLEAMKLANQSAEVGLPYSSFLLRVHQQEKASSILRSVIAKYPETTVAYVKLAEIEIEQGHWSEAYRQVEATRQLPGTQWVAWQIQGKIAFAQQKYAEAASAFAKASAEQPDNHELLKALATSREAAESNKVYKKT